MVEHFEDKGAEKWRGLAIEVAGKMWGSVDMMDVHFPIDGGFGTHESLEGIHEAGVNDIAWQFLS